jgi:hypothetical protein
MSNSTPGAAGIVAIIVAVVVVSEVITITTDAVVHWPFVAGGVLVGLLAVKSING